MLHEGITDDQELDKMRLVSTHFNAMDDDVQLLASVDVTCLEKQRLNCAHQTQTKEQRVEHFSTAAVYYGFDFGLVTC